MAQLDPLASLRGFASNEVLDLLGQILVFFPDEFRYRLKQVVDALPREGDNMHRVLELVRSQWKDIQSQEWLRLSIVGPAKTGKATLLDAILRKQAGPAAPIFAIVETPGLEEYLGYEKSREVPVQLREADMLLLLLDGRYGVSDSTVKMFHQLQRLDKPILVVLNKIDLVEKAGEAVRQARTSLGTPVFPVSAFRPESVDRLFNAIVSRNSKALYPLTQAFPDFRRTICNGIVTQSAMASSLVGAIAIPVSDLLPLTAIQTGMLLKIARAFGYQLNRGRARELIPMLVAGVLVREGSHRLRQRFPNQGRLIGVSVAGLWTFALGKAAIRYFDLFGSLLNRSEPLPALKSVEAS